MLMSVAIPESRIVTLIII